MTDTILFSFHCIQYAGRLGLATSYSRFPKKLLKISPSCSIKSQKLLFVTKLAQKLLKQKHKLVLFSLLLFGLMHKYAICTTKVTFLSIFAPFCVVTSISK